MTFTKVVFPLYCKPTRVSSISSFQKRDLNQSKIRLIRANMLNFVRSNPAPLEEVKMETPSKYDRSDFLTYRSPLYPLSLSGLLRLRPLVTDEVTIKDRWSCESSDDSKKAYTLASSQ